MKQTLDTAHSASFLLFLVMLVAAPILWNCSKDDDNNPASSTNRNANETSKYPEAARLEIPRLKGGVVNMFLVKTVPTYGVNYCVEWDIAKKAQRWTAFRWDTSYQDDNIGRTEAWSVDYDIPEPYRTNREEFYSGSGYTRGHMIASEDRQQMPRALNEQTFLYSNMHPQLYDFNGGIWLELEKKVRTWNNNAFRDTLYVVKGGTIDQESNILEYVHKGASNQLIVPKYFFMAILCKNKNQTNDGYKAIGFYMEHREDYTDTKKLSPYIVSIDSLEELTGIDFFCNLPDDIENKVESNVTPNAWGFN